MSSRVLLVLRCLAIHTFLFLLAGGCILALPSMANGSPVKWYEWKFNIHTLGDEERGRLIKSFITNTALTVNDNTWRSFTSGDFPDDSSKINPKYRIVVRADRSSIGSYDIKIDMHKITKKKKEKKVAVRELNKLPKSAQNIDELINNSKEAVKIIANVIKPKDTHIESAKKIDTKIVLNDCFKLKGIKDRESDLFETMKEFTDALPIELAEKTPKNTTWINMHGNTYNFTPRFGNQLEVPDKCKPSLSAADKKSYHFLISGRINTKNKETFYVKIQIFIKTEVAPQSGDTGDQKFKWISDKLKDEISLSIFSLTNDNAEFDREDVHNQIVEALAEHWKPEWRDKIKP